MLAITIDHLMHNVLPAAADYGVWQRFATKWAIVFTSSSQ
jgi:hypothetical protein